MCEFIKNFVAKLGTASGAIQILDEDETRVEAKILQAADRVSYNVWRWRSSTGLTLMAPVSSNGDFRGAPTDQRNLASPRKLVEALLDWSVGRSIVIAEDLNSLVNRAADGPLVARLIKDLNQKIMVEGDDNAWCQLVVVDTEESQFRCGYQKLDMPLPDRKELTSILEGVLEAMPPNVREGFDAASRERVLNAVAGLPAFQASNALAESYAKTGKISDEVVRQYKKQMVGAKGLEYLDSDPRGFDSIGGMDPLKEWCRKRSAAFDPELAKEYNIDPPRGMMIAGYPGTCKSQFAKALATEWGFTLLRFNVGQTRGMYQGQSENNFSEALKTAEAVAPCILFIDEAEKLFSGTGGGGTTDGGTTDRTFGEFLTWMQEKDSPVFVYMTANRPELLPDEFTRTGRLDARWWIDLPTETEREAIVGVFQSKYPKTKGIDGAKLVALSEGYTGAEIEAAFKESLLEALMEKRDVTTDDIEKQIQQTNQVAETFADKLEVLKKWKASAKVANSASAVETGTAKKAVRKLRQLK